MKKQTRPNWRGRLTLTCAGAAWAIAACGSSDAGPIALGDQMQLIDGGSVLIDVLANDRPPVGDTLVISGTTGGSGGIEIVEGQTIRYTPPAHLPRADAFIYTVESSDGRTASASVEVLGLEVIDEGETSSTPSSADGPPLSTTAPTVETTKAPIDDRRIDPRAVDFGVVAVGDELTRMMTLTAGTTNWEVEAVNPATHFGLVFDPDGACSSIAAGTSCETSLTWTPQEAAHRDFTLFHETDHSILILASVVEPQAPLATPQWTAPRGRAVSFEELVRGGLDARIEPVDGAAGYEVSAQLCIAGDCRYSGGLTEISDTQHRVLFELGPDTPEVREASSRGTVTLRFSAVASDDDRRSGEGTLVVDVVADALTVELLGVKRIECDYEVSARLTSHLPRAAELTATLFANESDVDANERERSTVALGAWAITTVTLRFETVAFSSQIGFTVDGNSLGRQNFPDVEVVGPCID